jgi:hypothetical protein
MTAVDLIESPEMLRAVREEFLSWKAQN